MPKAQNSIEARLTYFGQRQRHRHTLPDLAIEVATAAKAGEIDEDDANELYERYYKNSSGVTHPDPTEPSFKANASKLRQIVKAADPTTLKRLKEIWGAAAKEGAVYPLYHCMVSACRLFNDTGKQLPDKVLKDLVFKKN